MGEKIPGIRSINGRYKIDRAWLRMVWEMEKPRNLHVQPMDMNYRGGCWMVGKCRVEGE